MPHRLGGSAPTLAEAAQIEADEAAARAAEPSPRRAALGEEEQTWQSRSTDSANGSFRSLVAMNGTKFTFRGLENIPQRGGALLAQNHTSYLDWLPPLFAARERGRRMYFMIKAEMADVKAVNYVIKHARLIPVDRRRGHDAFAVAVQRLREGELIGMHPEATISRSFELREFKTGAARMALEAQVPIIPADRVGCPPDLAQRPSKEVVPQQGSDHRGRRTAAAAAW